VIPALRLQLTPIYFQLCLLGWWWNDGTMLYRIGSIRIEGTSLSAHCWTFLADVIYGRFSMKTLLLQKKHWSAQPATPGICLALGRPRGTAHVGRLRDQAGPYSRAHESGLKHGRDRNSFMTDLTRMQHLERVKSLYYSPPSLSEGCWDETCPKKRWYAAKMPVGTIVRHCTH